jgi:hypothetical protein
VSFHPSAIARLQQGRRRSSTAAGVTAATSGWAVCPQLPDKQAKRIRSRLATMTLNIR